MNVDTGAFHALTQKVADLAAEVETLRRGRLFADAFADDIEVAAEARGFARGRAASRHARTRSTPRALRGSHLQLVSGGHR